MLKGRVIITHIRHVNAACKWHQRRSWIALQYYKIHVMQCSSSTQFEHSYSQPSGVDLISLQLCFDFCLAQLNLVCLSPVMLHNIEDI